MNDYAFDAAGNTTRDAQFRKFTYDAENKQTKIESVDANGAVTGTIGEYFYDGDGRRVKKHVPSTGETTVFVYDASSRLVAEYSTNLNQTPQVAYLTNDHLGSPRINTNENGTVISRHDYRPYGEDITERSHAEYVGDTIRKQFTGYERDSETELDFAQARYFQFGHGRLTSADDVLNDSHASVPQSWNLFVYCGNNPTNKIDVNGKETTNSSDPNSRLSDERLELISGDLRRKTGATKGPKGTFQISFTDPSRRQKFVRWKLEGSR
ncbi:MAG: hypothetical protein IPJ30_10570 [Acidobacteria bacterium]|nr:hypothetical protein [Acidobacteriota bacterium]